MASLGSTLGIVTVFVTLCFACAALTELMQNRLQLRGHNLIRMLSRMVGREAAQRMLNSGYLRSLSDPGRPSLLPSSLPSVAVANAVLDVATGADGGRRDWRDLLAESGASAFSGAPAPAQEVLSRFVRESSNPDELLAHVVDWFEQIASRGTEWYRARLERLILGVALGLVVLVNVDTFQVVAGLQTDPELRTAAIHRADALLSRLDRGEMPIDQVMLLAQQSCGSPSGDRGRPVSQQALIDCVAGVRPPYFGWRHDPLYEGLVGDQEMSPAQWLGLALYKLLGLFVTAAALAACARLWLMGFEPLTRYLTRGPTVTATTEGDASPQQLLASPEPHDAAATRWSMPHSTAANSDEFRLTDGLRGFAPEALGMDLVNADWMSAMAALAYRTHEPVFETFMRRSQLQVEFFDGGATVAVAAQATTGRSGIEVRTVDTNGYIAWNDTDCFVVFAGAEGDLPSWFIDARLRRIDQWIDEQSIKLHEGLQAALSAVWHAGFSGPLPELIARFETGRRRIWLTGHGLGGALAQLAALALDQALTRTGNRFAQNWAGIRGIYSFGAPRIGDASFAEALDARCNRRLFRFVNSRDVIPRSPPTTQGYRDAGQLHYFDGMGHLKPDAPDWLLTQGLPEGTLLQLRGMTADSIDEHSIGQYRRHVQVELRRSGLVAASESMF